MKKLGLVGGLGPESTVMYYRGILEGTAAALGSDVLPQLTIESLNVFEVFRLCTAGRLDELAEYIGGAVARLAAAGCEVAAITANTPHIVYGQVATASPIPVVSVVEATRDAAVAARVRRVGLLGTEFTMANDFFSRPFAEVGIEVVTPNDAEMALIQERIATELELGIVREETRREFVAVIDNLRERAQIEQVILGCTELPLILDDAVSPVPCLDTAAIHIEALVRAIVTA